MLNIVIGSTNPVKIEAARHAFEQVFDTEVNCQGINAASEVSEQPLTEAETLQGAINRVKNCKHLAADYYIAIEGGVDTFSYGAATFAYVVIATQNKQSVGRSAQLPLPHNIYQQLLAGKELGPLMDELFQTENIKQKGGAIALLTNHHASRQSSYTQATIMALAPFMNPRLYP